MGNVIFENSRFYYENSENKDMLLDCSDFLSNKSKLPMHSANVGQITMPGLIAKLNSEYIYMVDCEEQKDNIAEYTLINILDSPLMSVI